MFIPFGFMAKSGRDDIPPHSPYSFYDATNQTYSTATEWIDIVDTGSDSTKNFTRTGKTFPTYNSLIGCYTFAEGASGNNMLIDSSSVSTDFLNRMGGDEHTILTYIFPTEAGLPEEDIVGNGTSNGSVLLMIYGGTSPNPQAVRGHAWNSSLHTADSTTSTIVNNWWVAGQRQTKTSPTTSKLTAISGEAGTPLTFTDSSITSYAYSPSGQLLTLGSRSSTQAYFDGNMAMVVIYDKALTNSEVQDVSTWMYNRFQNNTIDSNAQAFLSSAGITDYTASYAVNQLVVDLKDNNLWDEIDIFYPFVGTTLTSHTKNLKNPSTWSLEYVGGFPDEYSNNGLKFSGAFEYATIPGLNPNTYPFWSGGDASFGLTMNQTGSGTIPTAGIFQASSESSGSNADNMAYIGANIGVLGFNDDVPFGSELNTETYIVNRELADFKTQVYQSGVFVNENPGYEWNGGVRTTPDFAIGAVRVKTNFEDSVINYSDARFTSFFFGKSLSPSQISTLNDIVVNFNTLMGRNTLT